MLRRLDELSRKLLASDNSNLGERVAADLRASLERETDPSRRLHLQFRLAERLLFAGNVEEAIEGYLDALRLRGEVGTLEGTDVGAQDFAVGVAYMRMGEVDNCTLMHNADRCLLPIRDRGVHERKRGSSEAVRYFERVLRNPDARPWHRRARWLLNIAHMTLGTYPQGVAPAHRITEEAFRSQEDLPRFLDVAPRLGLDVMTLSGGALVEDFDGDGRMDLIVSDWHPRGQIRFFANRGEEGFEDRTEAAGLVGIFGGLNLVQADYDNDGDLDVLVLRGAWFGEWGAQPNSLLQNDGTGRFLDVTFAAGLSPHDYPTQTAAFADFDNDGDLDLFVGNEHNPIRMTAPCQLFRNQGNGTFTEVAQEFGVRNLGFTKGVAWGDYDADGWIDLYVSNMGQPNRLYRNLEGRGFRDVAVELGVEEPIIGFPVWFWDYDNDGALDLYASAYRMEIDEVIAGYLGLSPRTPLDRLYRGDGKGGFEDVALRLGLRRATIPMGANFGDLDNDGFLDFYLGTGYPGYDGLVPNLMFRNRSGHGFADVTTAGGFGHLQKGHAVTFADLDNDGDQDIFAEMGGAFPGDAFMNALFENPGFDRHWLKIRLVGVRSNRSAIGARIRIDLVERGRERSIFRHVGSGSSFGGNTLIQEIGLGAAERVERLSVYWPASDTTQRFEALDVDQAIEITEGSEEIRVLALPRVDFAKVSDRRGASHEHHH